jgi:hypothetical protein
MAAKLNRLTHKIAIQLHLLAESCTICSSRSRQPVRKLLDTPLYVFIAWYLDMHRNNFTFKMRTKGQQLGKTRHKGELSSHSVVLQHCDDTLPQCRFWACVQTEVLLACCAELADFHETLHKWHAIGDKPNRYHALEISIFSDWIMAAVRTRQHYSDPEFTSFCGCLCLSVCLSACLSIVPLCQ